MMFLYRVLERKEAFKLKRASESCWILMLDAARTASWLVLLLFYTWRNLNKVIWWDFFCLQEENDM